MVERMTGQLVLVAEDSATNQQVAAEMLEKLGYRSDVVRNGKEAVTAALAGSYAAVLMDCEMPEMDGYEATQEIRRRETSRHIPVIAMTANAMAADRDRCLAAGMDDYVSKPVRFERLAEALTRWVPTGQTDASPPDGGGKAATTPEALVEPFTAAPIDPVVVERLNALGPPGPSDRRAEVMRIFSEEADSTLKALRAAMRRTDPGIVQREAHRLKGAAGAISAREVLALSDELERLARDGSLAGAQELLQQLSRAVGEAVAASSEPTQGLDNLSR
jgi:CheY-like chemotaxis protein/HPt (histidine-containing phosphotransfer) domain-containing protein